MPALTTLCAIASVICFGLAAANVTGRVNTLGLGGMFLAAAHLPLP